MNYRMNFTHLQSIAVMFLTLLWLTTPAETQTVEHPIDIHMSASQKILPPGASSAVLITFRVPNGFWLGSNDLSARIPAATAIKMAGGSPFTFGEPRFPKPEVRGVPVHLGTTEVFTGEITVVVPLTVDAATPAGDYELVAKITYTPGLNAGHLTTHADEAYRTTLSITADEAHTASAVPEPTQGAVPAGFLVQEKRLQLPQPMQAMFHRWNEESAATKFLHWMFEDPENHGKHIQTVWHPFVGSTENNGQSIGGAMALMNTTREGIMTGTLDLRGYHNEYVGATAALDLVSCPAAYHNFWLTAQISEDRNRQAQLHVENLTLGADDRLGYELQVNAFQDPRYRFYGLGGGTNEEDETNYTHEEFGGALDLYILPADHWRFSVGGKIRSVDLKRGAHRLAEITPFTVNQADFASIRGINGATVVGERFNIVYDGRNQEFTPSAGFYMKLTAEYDQITSGETSTYGRFNIDLRKYFSTVNQRYTLLIRNGWTFTTSDDVPFFDQAHLGGEATLRAFDSGRFYGQHSVFGSVELRIQALHKVLMGFPMDLELAPFIDFGQVFSDSSFEGEFNVNPGLSLRLLNRPNIGVLANGALGQDGVIFTGGVSLPF